MHEIQSTRDYLNYYLLENNVWIIIQGNIYNQSFLTILMNTRKFIERILFSIALYSFFGGVYISGSAWFHPQTLPIQLSHLTPWIREDTFGIISWLVSFITF